MLPATNISLINNIVFIVSLETIEKTRAEVFTVKFDGSEYQAIFPEPLSAMNCSFKKKQDAWAYVVTQRINHPQGDAWKLENSNYVARLLWEVLSEIPKDNDDMLQAPFLHFHKGTDLFDVWLWFESYFNLSVMTAFEHHTIN